ncbi:MAG: hypothetical protein AAFY76_20180 [Cyanobacteria bacterium J06649_11]
MKQEFTPEQLIKFIYRETSLEENLEINEALYDSTGLFEEYESLMQGVQQLPKANFRPSTRCIQNILSYSAKTAAEPQH